MAEGELPPTTRPTADRLRQSLPAVRFLAASCFLAAAVTAFFLVLDLFSQRPGGRGFRRIPPDWFTTAGLILRVVGFAAVGWALTRYGRSARLGAGTEADRARLFAALSRFWAITAVVVGLLILHSLGVLWFVAQAPAIRVADPATSVE